MQTNYQNAVRTVAACLLMIGCGADNQDDTVLVRGLAEFGEPLVGGTATLRSLDGDVLCESTEGTYRTGTFTVRCPAPLPADFRLEVAGGSVGEAGAPWSGTLSAVVNAHDQETHSFYHVGPLSTILDRYVVAHPDATYGEAVEKLTDLLALPESLTLDNDFFFNQSWFDSDLFAAEARSVGSADAVFAELVAAMDQGVGSTRCFGGTCVSGVVTGTAGTAAKFIATNLAKGALSYVGGQAAGWVLNKASDLLGAGPSEQERIEQALAGQGEMLHALNADLTDLKTRLDDATNAILDEMAKQDYRAAVLELTDTISDFETSQDRLYWITQTDPTSEAYPELVRKLGDRLENVSVETQLTTISHVMTGLQTGVEDPAPALIDLWGRMQFEQGAHSKPGTQLTPEYRALKVWFEYWYSQQITGLNLAMEHLHYLYRDDARPAGDFLAKEQARIAEQAERYLDWVESLVAVTESGELNTIVSAGTAAILADADAYVGDILGLSSSVTVRLYRDPHNYSYQLGDSVHQELTLTLRADGDAQETYAATMHLNPSSRWQSDDRPLIFDTEFARFRFTDVEVGTTTQFRLVNANAALPAGYGCAPNLLSQAVLDHRIDANTGLPHGHMVAAAYPGKNYPEITDCDPW